MAKPPPKKNGEDVLTLPLPDKKSFGEQVRENTQPGPLIKTVTATRVEKFTEVEPQSLGGLAPSTQEPPVATAPTVPTTNVEPEEIAETLDVVRTLLEQIETDASDYVLSVYRLTNYAVDGKTGTRGTARKYLDRIPVTLDYLQDLKEMFGGGAYQIFLLTPKRTIKARWLEHIEGPPREDRSVQVIGNPVAVATAPNNSDSPLKQMIEFGKMWAELRGLVLETVPVGPNSYAASPAAVASPVSDDPPEPASRELELVLALLNSGTKRADVLADRILDRMFGGATADSGPSMGDLLSRLVEPFVPAIQTGLVEYFKAQAPAKAGRVPVTPTGNAAPGESKEAAANGNVADLEPPEDGEEMNEPYLDLVENLIMVMGVGVHQPETFHGMVTQAVTLVREFQVAEPDFADWIDSLLMMAPKGVLTSMVMLIPDAAPLRQNPDAVRFVEQLQVKLKATAAETNAAQQT